MTTESDISDVSQCSYCSMHGQSSDCNGFVIRVCSHPYGAEFKQYENFSKIPERRPLREEPLTIKLH